MVTRLFTYITLISYLVVGVVAVRVLSPEMTSIEVSSHYLSLFTETTIETAKVDTVVAPEMMFAEINFPVEKKVIVKTERAVVKTAPQLKVVTLAKNELPFKEAVELSPIRVNPSLPQNLISLYKDFTFDESSAALAAVTDEVSTKLAVDAEPEFFDYSEVENDVVKKEEKIAAQKTEEVSTIPQTENNVSNVDNVEVAPEEIAVDELVTFDYSKASEDIKSESVPTLGYVTTQAQASTVAPSKVTLTTQKQKPHTVSKASSGTSSEALTTQANANKSHFLAPDLEYPNRMTIQVTGTDLSKTVDETGFEVRFQDDQNDIKEDHNTGSITVDQVLATPKMTRSVVVLKRGYAPTNTDLILEEGVTEVTLPLVTEEKFNELLAAYESRGAIGAVLIELDPEAEGAALDVPFSQVLTLDEDMKVTSEKDYSYLLFVGVKAGNALLTYKKKGEVTSKLIHIHERELTFESNFFEDDIDEKVSLLEEDLLSKEKTPLIISGSAVKVFATEKTAKKINDHTYKLPFGRTLLGGRRYIELGHQEEALFVGLKDATIVEVPSESFMRYVLSRFEGASLGNRCLIQVNLGKRAVKVDVGSESVNETLVTYTQILDADGKFYDSIGPKSRRIIIIGENQGSPDFSQDGKVNIKITYENGSVEFMPSYCSPNTYLVEQL